MKLGAQFYTLREQCQTLEGLSDSLKRVADIGYTTVQLSGVCSYEPEWMKEEFKKNGLTISNAMHLSSWLGKEIEIAAFDHDKFYELLMERVKTSKRRTEVREVKVDMNASFRKEEKDEELYLRNGLGRGL